MGNVLFMRKGETHSKPIALPKIGTPLNDCTWEDIHLISTMGLASSYFSIGDKKEIAIKGTVGTLDVDTTLYAYIIGFNHNGTTNTVDFGTFKTTDGIDVALIDSNYRTYSEDGTKYFNINHSSDSNSGGWKACDLRYDVLGSTDISGEDATENCAINPVANTLMAALPSDLRAVMKPMTIYTDNKGNKNTTTSGITTTVDYLPLLAEFEVFGKRDYANNTEQTYQKQYEYYSAGNSTLKYKHNNTSSKAYWWERSPYYNSSSNFCCVNTSGDVYNSTLGTPQGIAPIFRV